MSEEPVAPAPREHAPAWARDLIHAGTWAVALAIIVGGLGLLAILTVVDKISDFVLMFLTALFLSFALEPAVNWLAGKGMRRGFGSGLVFLAGIAGFVLILALIIPAIISGFIQLIENAPEFVAKLARWLEPFGIEFSQEDLLAELQRNADSVTDGVGSLIGGIFSVTSSILGGLFRWSAIGLFAFYLVAEGPKLRRVVCSTLPPERQQRVLFIWNEAIDQTGGYFYSRLLLAIVNGTGMFIVLLLFDVPFAAPLAVFAGAVSAFIPIIGTYIGGAVPILFAFLTSMAAGIAATAYVLIYQQLENLWLSPRLTAKTMSLHPAVAFAAALIGGAMGGILFAFLALPAAGVLQAAVRSWGRRYAVVDDELTDDKQPPVGPGIMGRVRKGLRDMRDEEAEESIAPGSSGDPEEG